MSGLAAGLRTDGDGVPHCWWCGDDAAYVRYHHEEWGFPVADETRLYEKLCLEGFQAGLSWLTILRKRENFRAAFRGFDPERVARFGTRDIRRLLADAGIVRHRGKIESTIHNARRTLELRTSDDPLPRLVWSFAPPPDAEPVTHEMVSTRARTDASTALSRALKQRGFSFIGPTTCYAFMQSVGLVNDHLTGCATRSRVVAARRAFRVPL